MHSRFDIYCVNLDPTLGSEIKKTRPAVIISPDEMNRNISTIIIAPVTSQIKNYPTRITCTIDGRQGQIVLDQIRAIDKTRLVQKIETLNKPIQKKVINMLKEMFSE